MFGLKRKKKVKRKVKRTGKSKFKRKSNSLTIPTSLRKKGWHIGTVIVNPRANRQNQLTEKKLVSGKTGLGTKILFKATGGRFGGFSSGESIPLSKRLDDAGKTGISTRRAREY